MNIPRAIRRGDWGQLVKALQINLGITADRIFGMDTERAVKRFQEAQGLHPDGVVGPVTWDLLLGTTDTAAPLPYPSSLTLTDDGSGFVEGVDVSGWNKVQDWGPARKVGIGFAIVKVSGGLHGSRKSAEHYKVLGEAGILRGAYHFADFKHAGKTQAREQAENFFKQAAGIGDWELPLWLDAEWMTYVSGHTPEKEAANKAARLADLGKSSSKFPARAVEDWCLEFGARMVELSGERPAMYTGQNFWRYRLGKSTAFRDWLLWVVAYMPKSKWDANRCPEWRQMKSMLVGPKGGWVDADIWQWSGWSSPDWYEGNKIDRNLFRGTLDDLRALKALKR